MKILQILNKDVPTHDYRVYLQNIENIEIEFIVPPTTKRYKGITKHEIKLSGGFNLKKDIKAIWELFFFLLNNRYDILHWYSTKYYLIGPLLALMTLHFKNIITINGFGRVFTSKKYALLKPIFISFYFLSVLISKKVIVQNQDDLEFSKNILPVFLHEKIILVHSGVLPNEKKINIRKRPFTIINISRIMDEKGIQEFLEIAKTVKQQNENIEFILIGESSGNKYLDEKVSEYKNNKIIKYIKYTDKPFDYLLDSNLLLFTSHREGMPRVVLEAMSISLPTIAYDVIGVRETVSNNVNGLLFNLSDIENIANKILALELDHSILQKLSDNCQIIFNNNFSMNHFIKNMKQVYMEIEC